MTLYLDASAIIAILADEPEEPLMAKALADDSQRICAPVTVWETVAGLRRSHNVPIMEARNLLRAFFREIKLGLISIGDAETELALDAYQRFGRGRHPAALNMGDCFAYACARSHDARLLYIGDDFAKTDIDAPSGSVQSR